MLHPRGSRMVAMNIARNLVSNSTEKTCRRCLTNALMRRVLSLAEFFDGSQTDFVGKCCRFENQVVPWKLVEC